MTIGTPAQRRRARIISVVIVLSLGTAVFVVPNNDAAQVTLGLTAVALGLYGPYVYVFDRNEGRDDQYRTPEEDEAHRHCDDCDEKYTVSAYEDMTCPSCGSKSHGVSNCDEIHN